LRVLVIGDTHIPFVHPNYLRFLKEIAEDYEPDKIVHIGDLVDHHALSRFVSDPDGLTSGNEWKASLDELSRFSKAFPEVEWVIGNHDARPFIKAYDSQIPEAFIRTLEEIYGLPEGWKVKPKTEIDGVLYTHGLGGGGQWGWQGLSLKQGQSTVIGHFHSVGGVRYHRSPIGQNFTMVVGSGVDEDSYAMAYGKGMPARPVLGCGLVEDGVYAQFIPMDMGERRFYRKRRQVL
jgi:predicted phosphodiesterase